MRWATGILALVTIGVAQAEDYRIGAATAPYFVCDSRVIEDRWLLERFTPPLTKHPANPLIVKEHEWEGSGPHMGGSVVYDPEAKLYRMWHSVFSRHNYDNRLPFSYNVCYAESDDGIVWRKPALGVFDHEADPANNYIRLGTDKTQNIDVCLNPRPDVYPGKFLAIHNQKGGVFVSHSDDGKIFTFLQDQSAIPYHSDTHNNFVYDDTRDRWLLFCRPRAYAGDHKRRVSLQSSADLRTWTHERTILVPDEADTAEFYGMTVFRRGDLFFGMLQNYDRESGFMTPELRWSADGEQWDRVATHPVWIARGAEGEWDHGMVMPAESPVVVGDEMRFYYGGFALDHHAAENPCAIGLATAERDRLVGLRPSSDEAGYALTRPFVVEEGSALLLNAIVRDGGAIAAEIRTDGNKPIEGFEMDASDGVTASGFAQPLTWGGKALGELAGQEVRIRFEVGKAELFAFAFE